MDILGLLLGLMILLSFILLYQVCEMEKDLDLLEKKFVEVTGGLVDFSKDYVITIETINDVIHNQKLMIEDTEKIKSKI